MSSILLYPHVKKLIFSLLCISLLGCSGSRREIQRPQRGVSLSDLITHGEMFFVGQVTKMEFKPGPVPERIITFRLNSLTKFRNMSKSNENFDLLDESIEIRQFEPDATFVQVGDILGWYVTPESEAGFRAPVADLEGFFLIYERIESSSKRFIAINRVGNNGLWGTSRTSRLWGEDFPESLADQYLRGYYPTYSKEERENILQIGRVPLVSNKPLPLEFLLAANFAYLAQHTK